MADPTYDHITLAVRTRDDGPDRSQLHCKKCNTYFIRNAPLSVNDELEFRQRHQHQEVSRG